MKGNELVSIVSTIENILKSTYANYGFDTCNERVKNPTISIVLANDGSEIATAYIPYTCMLVTNDKLAVFAVADPIPTHYGETFSHLYVFGDCDDSDLIYTEKALHIAGVTRCVKLDDTLASVFGTSGLQLKELFDYFEDKCQTRDASNYPTNLDILDKAFNNQ